MKIEKNEIRALVSLLEDSDEQVIKIVSNKLKEIGIATIPYLESGLKKTNNKNHKLKINRLLREFKISRLALEIKNWKEHDEADLLKGLITIAKYGQEQVDEDAIYASILEIEKAITSKIELNNNTDLIEILNEVILKEFNFKANLDINKGANASYINKVLEYKSGYPIMLCAIYLLMAQKFNIPLIGINSPRHFILAYIGNNINTKTAMPDILMKNVLYFLDPYLQGSIYQAEDFKKLLKASQFDMIFFSNLAASNTDILKRVINNVTHSIYTDGKENTAKRLLKIAEEL
ncbi:MAG: transglutaminase family protein [Chitinophagaceae bacterium]